MAYNPLNASSDRNSAAAGQLRLPNSLAKRRAVWAAMGDEDDNQSLEVLLEDPTDELSIAAPLETSLPVAATYGPTVQGEGALTGRPAMVLSLGGCDLRCTWCDSLYAVRRGNQKNWDSMTPAAIVADLRFRSPCRLVVITGGNPALHDCSELVYLLQRRDYEVWVETQGTVWRPWLQLANLVISPKPPSAGVMTALSQVERFLSFFSKERAGRASAVIKVVVDPALHEDRDYALAVRTRVPQLPFYLSCVTYPRDKSADILERYQQMCEWTIATPKLHSARVLPQLQVLTYGHGRRS